MWVEADLGFGNTSRAWLDAFDTLAQLCGRIPERIQEVLSNAELYPSLLVTQRQVPAGIPLPRDDRPRSVFRLATSVYKHFLQDSVPDDPLYRVSPDTNASRRTCEIVCELIRESSRDGGWTWDFFDPSKELSGERGFFWTFDAQELNAYLGQHAVLAFYGGSIASASFGAVGRPTVGPISDPDDPAFDYLIRLDLKSVASGNPAYSFAVPSVWDGRGWPFFLPGGDRDPRSGRTVNVPIYNLVPAEGIREWVHPGVRLGESLEKMEPIGPVRRLPCPPGFTEAMAGVLLGMLRERINP